MTKKPVPNRPEPLFDAEDCQAIDVVRRDGFGSLYRGVGARTSSDRARWRRLISAVHLQPEMSLSKPAILRLVSDNEDQVEVTSDVVTTDDTEPNSEQIDDYNNSAMSNWLREIASSNGAPTPYGGGKVVAAREGNSKSHFAGGGNADTWLPIVSKIEESSDKLAISHMKIVDSDGGHFQISFQVTNPKIPVVDMSLIGELNIWTRNEATHHQSKSVALEFELVSQRYERSSTLITSNLPFEEWTETFGYERLTGALLDRLTHHVSILEMNGESYRLCQSRKATQKH